MSTTGEKKSVRICHISDIHLPLSKPVPPLSLFGKRLLGWANLKLVRGKTHRQEVFESLMGELARERRDLIIITGDIANLCLEFEYREVERILLASGISPEEVIILPGNHDRYTPLADSTGSFEKHMADWLPPWFSRNTGYPIIRTFDQVAVAAIDTAIWRGPIRAAGVVRKDQISRLADFLEECDHAGRWPIMAMHHPPFELAGSFFRDYRSGLACRERLLNAIGRGRGTMLHGHLHVLSRSKVGGLDTIGVASASNDTGRPDIQAAYHVYTFDETGLVDAEIVRHWPNTPGKPAFERSPLPEEAEGERA